jgi:hypothetical protein
MSRLLTQSSRKYTFYEPNLTNYLPYFRSVVYSGVASVFRDAQSKEVGRQTAINRDPLSLAAVILQEN